MQFLSWRAEVTLESMNPVIESFLAGANSEIDPTKGSYCLPKSLQLARALKQLRLPAFVVGSSSSESPRSQTPINHSAVGMKYKNKECKEDEGMVLLDPGYFVYRCVVCRNNDAVSYVIGDIIWTISSHDPLPPFHRALPDMHARAKFGQSALDSKKSKTGDKEDTAEPKHETEAERIRTCPEGCFRAYQRKGAVIRSKTLLFDPRMPLSDEDMRGIIWRLLGSDPIYAFVAREHGHMLGGVTINFQKRNITVFYGGPKFDADFWVRAERLWPDADAILARYAPNTLKGACSYVLFRKYASCSNINVIKVLIKVRVCQSMLDHDQLI